MGTEMPAGCSGHGDAPPPADWLAGTRRSGMALTESPVKHCREQDKFRSVFTRHAVESICRLTFRTRRRLFTYLPDTAVAKLLGIVSSVSTLVNSDTLTYQFAPNEVSDTRLH